MVEIMIDVLGICGGNLLWLLGLLIFLAGIWGISVKPEGVFKMVGMMGMASGGEPEGLAEMLIRMVDPVDRSSLFGVIMVIAGVLVMGAGGWLIKISM